MPLRRTSGPHRYCEAHWMAPPTRSKFRVLRWLMAAAIVCAIILLGWGGDFLIASDPAPQHADAAIVLQGSIAGEKVRIAGAMHLLQQGIADRALLSVPKESYWGEYIPPVARSFLDRTYGHDLASRVDFCETGEDVNSTVQEAQALLPCIQEHHCNSVVIVTSNYHTRRAGMLWRKVTKPDPNLHIWMEGVADPEFQQPWWRHRRSAKTWVTESTKLVWTSLGEQ
jgi:uncharacterized SAM-binding protein YcdF (DUF218 family)